MKLESYICGEWVRGRDAGVVLCDASSGEPVAEASSSGIDFAEALRFARREGGPRLRAMSFHERAGLLRGLAKGLLERKESLYELSYCTGATREDSWIDIEGGIGTLFAYASKGVRELPNARVIADGAVEPLSKGGTFMGQHLYVSREGAAVHINAFNFPVWGMLEKLAPAFLAGVPVIVKPATPTAYLAQRAVRELLALDLMPRGALQIVCGSLGDLFEHLTCQDFVAFTGSAHTAASLRTHPAVVRASVPFTAETDSLNASILAPEVPPGSAELDLFVREVVREMTVKAGQKCTAIRKAIVPEGLVEPVTEALRLALSEVVVGDPRVAGVRMGPLASLAQRRDVLAQVAALERESEVLVGDPDAFSVRGADRMRGAFVPPLLLKSRDPRTARWVHELEPFGPVATLMTYADRDEAVELARRGGGSLVASVVSADARGAAELVLRLAPYHGRILVLDASCAKESTGHGSPLAPLVHGGPGRAGGGEELGGVRGVLHYMQRIAVQGSPDTLTAFGLRWVRGSRRRDPGRHPFRIAFHELELGDTFESGEREVTTEDIERFAALSGDRFYAHMSEEQARRNPLFGGRVAHGYFLISAAAGLFVDPDYGPVLGNYGIDQLRFVKPVKPGTRIRVRLTCAAKSLRADKGWGEVAWDTQITDQNGDTVASYDVLTMVSVHEVPDQAERPRAG
ncbi:MAG TPA: phenylacetic acid degradation bifunctional protein PaaZ [Steroidobacteraceae bacterium]|nr:phenylacetic acid degradation bifunctional protein PaaZ [Steroidobacteraceae bacterium]